MMVQRLYKFLVVLFLLTFSGQLKAQSRPLTVVPAPVVFIIFSNAQWGLKPGGSSLLTPKPSLTPGLLTLPANATISADYYTKHFGFFCKKELQFEKATAIPLRFRLGSLDYVNKMEGK